jgi:recombination protein RecT
MTTKVEELKTQMAQSAGVVATEKPRTPNQLVGDYLEKMMPSISAVLPKHVTADRMSRIALNVIRSNPKLLECELNSLMGGVMEASKLGLEPGLMGQCYLIPFKNNKTNRTEAQFIIGYKGLIDLVRRSGQISTIDAREVCENDEFDYQYGLDDKLHHKPSLTDRGAVIAYYAIAKMKDGGYSFHVMSRSDVEKHRDKYAKAKTFGPWKDEFDGMAKKTVLRQLIKYLPISVENLGNFDEASGADVHQDVEKAHIIDMGEYVPPIADVDYDEETGEVK